LWKVTRSTRPDSGSRSSAELNRGFPLGATLHIFQTRDVRPLSGRVRPTAHYSGLSFDERQSAEVSESGFRLYALCGFAKPDPREKQFPESRAIAALVMPELKCCDEALSEKGPSPFQPGPHLASWLISRRG
ncbi:MAG: hypothetical protein ACLPQY_05625, partial [Streptosporangiaceae bacterium]